MKVLWVGDAACTSGFALATHKILETVHEQCDVTVLGINYRGDPHAYPYPIYAAEPGGDAFGVGRLLWMCDLVQPDLIVVQQDGWNVPFYTRQLARCPEHAHIPLIAIVAVDGKNFDGSWLDGVSHAIFWTEFGRDEAVLGGYRGLSSVIPLGVDLDVYCPMDKYEARLQRGLPRQLDDAFIVGNVNRNQPRKRWDLTLRYFSEWVRSRKVEDAWLYLHAAPTGESCIDVDKLAAYYDVRLISMQPATFYGITEQEMRATYNCFDVQITTTQGEGFGLTTFEGMACGVPQIVPRWSALGELVEASAVTVPCTSTIIGAPYRNVIGGVADEVQFIRALDAVYGNPVVRQKLQNAGRKCVEDPRYRWESIGQRYVEVLASVGVPSEVAV